MLTSHALLLKYRHDHRFSFSDVGVWYVDRGAPGDRSWTFGKDILVLEPQYFEVVSGTKSKRIPYHRIRRITYAGAVVWQWGDGPAE